MRFAKTFMLSTNLLFMKSDIHLSKDYLSPYALESRI